VTGGEGETEKKTYEAFCTYIEKRRDCASEVLRGGCKLSIRPLSNRQGEEGESRKNVWENREILAEVNQRRRLDLFPTPACQLSGAFSTCTCDKTRGPGEDENAQEKSTGYKVLPVKGGKRRRKTKGDKEKKEWNGPTVKRGWSVAREMGQGEKVRSTWILSPPWEPLQKSSGPNERQFRKKRSGAVTLLGPNPSVKCGVELGSK